jgi:hypothetical protein
MPRGGKREGAGRQATRRGPLKRVVALLDADELERLERLQDVRVENASEVLRAGLECLDQGPGGCVGGQGLAGSAAKLGK